MPVIVEIAHRNRRRAAACCEIHLRPQHAQTIILKNAHRIEIMIPRHQIRMTIPIHIRHFNGSRRRRNRVRRRRLKSPIAISAQNGQRPRVIRGQRNDVLIPIAVKIPGLHFNGRIVRWR